MKKTKIIFETIYDPVLEKKILKIIDSGELDNATLLNISEVLGKKYKIGTKSWEKLRFHLLDMTKRGLIEERHFGKNANDWNGVVNYAIESKGVKQLRKV